MQFYTPCSQYLKELNLGLLVVSELSGNLARFRTTGPTSTMPCIWASCSFFVRKDKNFEYSSAITSLLILVLKHFQTHLKRKRNMIYIGLPVIHRVLHTCNHNLVVWDLLDYLCGSDKVHSSI